MGSMRGLGLLKSTTSSLVLLFFSGPQEVIGSLNQSVTVVCCYGQAYKSYVKYWCKGNFSLCHVLVNTTGLYETKSHDRISITDDQTQRAFTVTMTGLREDDKGQYYCAIETGEDSAEYFGVYLQASSGVLCAVLVSRLQKRTLQHWKKFREERVG
uniref:Immunoglobulin domain-containing protein n=1 Tax=Erpetoichthys calabaricus TaxID=27687 RepID=A0A8C4RQ92_ERPCA